MPETAEKPSLFNKNFVLLWHSQLISQIGSQAFYVAMIFWIKHATGSATLMGTLMMAAMLPGAILGPLGGVIADYYSRKKIIVWCDLLCGFFVVLFAGLFAFIPHQINLLLFCLFIISILVAISRAFFNPAVLAAIPDVVDISNVAAGNSITQASTQLASFIGLGAGGILFRILGAPLLFMTDGLSYLYAGIMQLFMDIPQVIPERNASLRQRIVSLKAGIGESFSFIWRDKGMRRTFLLSGAMNFFFAPDLVIFPFYVENVMKARSDWYGYLIASFGAGAMLGYLGSNVLKLGPAVKGYWIVFFLILLSAANFLLGLIHTPGLAMAVILLCGGFTGYINVSIINQLQVNTGPDMRGRVFGNLTTITVGIMPIALGLTGIIVDALDKKVDLIFKGCGIGMLLVTFLVAFSKDFLQFFAKTPEEAAA